MDGNGYREHFPTFADATERFYSGEMPAKEYKGISGGFGSYAQRGGERSMVRLRLAGGRVSGSDLGFIRSAIEEYRPEMVHLTTCQSIQLHGLDGEQVIKLVDSALEHGIVTYGGGGDYPRNVTATPLSGIINSADPDVQPFAKAAERYLLKASMGVKLPRKLKVGFSNTMENNTDATARDLGFVTNGKGAFDVYSGGGLGANPKLGILIEEDVPPEDVGFYLKAMLDMFVRHGNYEDRSKARVRYIRDSMGDEGYAEELRRLAEAARKDPDARMEVPKTIVTTKRGDGSVPKSQKAKPQRQDGLYYVAYHPIGGDPKPEKMVRILKMVEDVGAEIRVGPNQTLYAVNLTGSEADMFAELADDGARTRFQSSISCVGSTVCQIGLRDSKGLLDALVEMDRRNGFKDGTLPTVRISGCVSSCAAHQVGTLSFKGCPSIEGEPAFELHFDGSHVRGKERLGTVLGRMRAADIPGFLEDMGRSVEASGKDFYGWCDRNPSRIIELAGRRLMVRAVPGDAFHRIPCLPRLIFYNVRFIYIRNRPTGFPFRKSGL